MAARKVRRVFATPFVITVATSSCSKREEKPRTPALRMYQVVHESFGVCAVEDTCPKDIDCKVGEPFAYRCSYSMAPDDRFKHPTRDRTYLYGEIDGHCYLRPFGCAERTCFGKEVPCIERPTSALTTQAWTVKAKGGTCRVEPLPVASISPTLPAYTMPCPKEYAEDGPYFVRVSDPADDGPCEVREDYDCEPGATCNPPAPSAVACPPK